MNEKNIIGDRLYNLRNNKKLTLEQLSKLIKISKGHLSELESGKSTPTIQTLLDICEFYGLNLISFFTSIDIPLTINSNQLELLRLTEKMTDEQIMNLNQFIKSISSQ